MWCLTQMLYGPRSSHLDAVRIATLFALVFWCTPLTLHLLPICFPCLSSAWHEQTCRLTPVGHCRSMHVQALSSADVRQAMEEAEEEEEEASTQRAAAQMQTAASSDLLTAAAELQGDVEQWLASSGHDQQASTAPEMPATAVEASGSSPSVACLVQQFEALPADQPTAAQPPLTELTATDIPAPIQPAKLLANRLRLTPLRIDDDVGMPGDEEDTESAAVLPDWDYEPSPIEVGLQPSVPGTAATTPRARHQSALQGATARNQAAVKAHRARLHMKEHSAAGGTPQHDSAAVPHAWAGTPGKKAAAPASPRPAAPQRSLQAGSAIPTGVDSSTIASDPATEPPRPPLNSFGSVASPSSLRSAQSLSPAAAPRTALRRGGSGAFPSTHTQAQSPRAQSAPPPTLHNEGSVTVAQIMNQNSGLQRGCSVTVAQIMNQNSGLQRGGSVTGAQIMKQNSRLPPLDHAPSAQSSPSPTRRPLPLLRRGSSVAVPSALPSALKQGASADAPLRRGASAVPSSTADHATRSPSSPQWWSEPADHGSIQSDSRRNSLTFSPDSRRRLILRPISPRKTGSGVPLMRGVSGNPRSPNR